MLLIISVVLFLVFAGMLFIPAIISIFKPEKKGIVIYPDENTEIKIIHKKEK